MVAQVIEEGAEDAGLVDMHGPILLEALERLDAHAVEEWLLIQVRFHMLELLMRERESLHKTVTRRLIAAHWMRMI